MKCQVRITATPIRPRVSPSMIPENMRTALIIYAFAMPILSMIPSEIKREVAIKTINVK